MAIPKYREIYEDLKGKITKGIYIKGRKMPGEIDLAKIYNVSRITSRQALSLLEKEGYVIRKRKLGTIVNNLKKDNTPFLKLRHLGFVLVDVDPGADYYIWEITAAEEWLSKNNIILSVTTLKTSELLQNKPPILLQNETVQGFILDGFVQNFHCNYIERLGRPFLVEGNVAIDKKYPQIRFDIKKIVETAMDLLFDINPKKPILLLVEPFKFHYTREIYQSYSSYLIKKRKGSIILQTCESDNGYAGMKNLLARGYKKFSLITTDRIVRGVLALYKEMGFSSVENPIVVLGNEKRISEWEKQQIYLAPLNAEYITLKAVEFFKEIFEDSVQNIHKDLRVDIKPPDFSGEGDKVEDIKQNIVWKERKFRREKSSILKK